MIIIDRTFKGTEDLHEYLRTLSGFIEATKEEHEAWIYDAPLWTSPSNFLGCELIYRNENVGPIVAVNIGTTHRGSKNLSFDTLKGSYKFSYCHVKFFNKLYDK